ncbi:type II toxin-antitoxin system death-on-curing family toxin [Agromyces sp. Marseille-Q5079]|uniref:type II toxin-antitoxin system death-on-curing family toxin n=1 Tax=Agromyces sp. Marseille-Q5079 TaxID=3439059 RepID=UPI003D9C9B50
MFEYLEYEDIVGINDEHTGGSVINEGGIRANLGRLTSGFGGADLFPDVWSKAAVLLSAFSRTQYFGDGNKRTAWLSTLLFLELNDIKTRRVETIHAEVFVLAIAANALDDPSRDRSELEMIQEWLKAAFPQSADGILPLTDVPA